MGYTDPSDSQMNYQAHWNCHNPQFVENLARHCAKMTPQSKYNVLFLADDDKIHVRIVILSPADTLALDLTHDVQSKKYHFCIWRGWPASRFIGHATLSLKEPTLAAEITQRLRQFAQKPYRLLNNNCRTFAQHMVTRIHSWDDNIKIGTRDCSLLDYVTELHHHIRTNSKNVTPVELPDLPDSYAPYYIHLQCRGKTSYAPFQNLCKRYFNATVFNVVATRPTPPPYFALSPTPSTLPPTPTSPPAAGHF